MEPIGKKARVIGASSCGNDCAQPTLAERAFASVLQHVALDRPDDVFPIGSATAALPFAKAIAALSAVSKTTATVDITAYMSGFHFCIAEEAEERRFADPELFAQHNGSAIPEQFEQSEYDLPWWE